MHTIDTLNTDASRTGRFYRGRRQATVTTPKEAAESSIDTLRTYAPHDAGYGTAQSYGFAIIREIEEALRNRDSWAGRYTGRIDAETGDYTDIDDCSGQYDQAHVYAMDLAADAAMGNARGIVVAQGRSDEVARLILAVGPTPG